MLSSSRIPYSPSFYEDNYDLTWINFLCQKGLPQTDASDLTQVYCSFWYVYQYLCLPMWEYLRERSLKIKISAKRGKLTVRKICHHQISVNFSLNSSISYIAWLVSACQERPTMRHAHSALLVKISIFSRVCRSHDNPLFYVHDIRVLFTDTSSPPPTNISMAPIIYSK